MSSHRSSHATTGTGAAILGPVTTTLTRQNWKRSSINGGALAELVTIGIMPHMVRHRAAAGEREPSLRYGEVVLFAAQAKCSLELPTSPFIGKYWTSMASSHTISPTTLSFP